MSVYDILIARTPGDGPPGCAKLDVKKVFDDVDLPSINMMIGASDTDQVCALVPNAWTLTTLLIQPVDTTTHTKSALASEITITVYVNGVAKFSAISTSGDSLIESVLGTPVSLTKGDVIAALPSAAPGTGKQVLLTLVGTWS